MFFYIRIIYIMKNPTNLTSPESGENQTTPSKQNCPKELLETIKTKTKTDALELIAQWRWEHSVVHEIKKFTWLDKDVALALIEKGICYALSDCIQYFNLQESAYKEIAYELMRHGRADAIMRNISKFTWLTWDDLSRLNRVDILPGRRDRQSRNILYKIYEEKITISPTPNIIKKYLTIWWWSNQRVLYIDREKNETYFQVTSHCYSCPTCEERIQRFWYKTSYHFYQLNEWYALYQKFSGVPKDDSLESIKSFLYVDVESVS